MRTITLFLLLSALTNADIVKLVKAGLSAETIEAKIASSETSFDTSTDALVALANDGVPDRVVRAMITHWGAGVPPASAGYPARQQTTASDETSAAGGRDARPPVTSRRYDVAVHGQNGGRCDGGELRIDGKGLKASQCRKLDFELRWPAIRSACYAYGFRGELVVNDYRISTTTPAELRRIVEHIRASAPAVQIGKCEG